MEYTSLDAFSCYYLLNEYMNISAYKELLERIGLKLEKVDSFCNEFSENEFFRYYPLIVMDY